MCKKSDWSEGKAQSFVECVFCVELSVCKTRWSRANVKLMRIRYELLFLEFFFGCVCMYLTTVSFNDK